MERTMIVWRLASENIDGWERYADAISMIAFTGHEFHVSIRWISSTVREITVVVMGNLDRDNIRDCKELKEFRYFE